MNDTLSRDVIRRLAAQASAIGSGDELTGDGIARFAELILAFGAQHEVNDTTQVISKIDKAIKTVGDLCAGTQRWTMSIPVRPDSDPDVIICDALMEARALLASSAAPVADPQNPDCALTPDAEIQPAITQADAEIFKLPYIGPMLPNPNTGKIELLPNQYRGSLQRYARRALRDFVASGRVRDDSAKGAEADSQNGVCAAPLVAPVEPEKPAHQMLTVEQMESLIVKQCNRIFELENAADPSTSAVNAGSQDVQFLIGVRKALQDAYDDVPGWVSTVRDLIAILDNKIADAARPAVNAGDQNANPIIEWLHSDAGRQALAQSGLRAEQAIQELNKARQVDPAMLLVPIGASDRPTAENAGAQPVDAQADTRDAARYRWLRNDATVLTLCVHDESGVRYFYEGLDTAIDAAMSKEQ